jgi:hypothetical protein
MIKLFSEDLKKDLKLVGTIYTLKGIDERGIDLKGKLIDVNLDSNGQLNYCFKITTKDTQWDEFITKIPNNGDIS